MIHPHWLRDPLVSAGAVSYGSRDDLDESEIWLKGVTGEDEQTTIRYLDLRILHEG